MISVSHLLDFLNYMHPWPFFYVMMGILFTYLKLLHKQNFRTIDQSIIR